MQMKRHSWEQALRKRWMAAASKGRHQHEAFLPSHTGAFAFGEDKTPAQTALSTQYHHSTHSWLSTPSSYLILSKRVREIHLITEGLEHIKLHCKSHSVRSRWWFIHTYSNHQLTPLFSMPRCIQLGFPLPGLLLNRCAFRMPSKVWMWDPVDISGLLPTPHPHIYNTPEHADDL